MKNTFKIGDIFKASWETTKNNIWFLVSSSFIYFVIYMLLNREGNNPSSFLLSIAGGIVSILFSLGMYRIGFKIKEGKTPEYSDFKTEPHTFFTALWASVITGFFTFLGFILLIIPGFIVMTRLSMTTLLILDKNLSGRQAVKESWRLTKGYSWKIFGFLIISFILIVISILPFGLGLILSVPYVYLTAVELYKKIMQGSVEVMPAPEVAVISATDSVE